MFWKIEYKKILREFPKGKLIFKKNLDLVNLFGLEMVYLLSNSRCNFQQEKPLMTKTILKF